MKTVILTGRDRSLLYFLWRWKLLSTAALTEAFFGDRSPITAYVRLWHLKAANYIQFVSDAGGTAFLWTIAPKGFHAIQDRLPDLAEAGFKSENVKHDSLVTALHLGEWLTGVPDAVEVFTEQEASPLPPRSLPGVGSQNDGSPSGRLLPDPPKRKMDHDRTGGRD